MKVYYCLWLLTYGINDKSHHKDRQKAEDKRESNTDSREGNVTLYSHCLDHLADNLTHKGSSVHNSSSGGALDYLDGKNFTDKDVTKCDLGKTASGENAEILNKWIESQATSNSKMRGFGELYMKAGKESGLDPRYLVAHDAVETGWGTSNLSKGGDPNKGNWNCKRNFDNNPSNCCNYRLGIVWIACWIRDKHYNKGSKYLHDMRHNNGVLEYATAGNWDTLSSSRMKGSDRFHSGPGGGSDVMPRHALKTYHQPKNLKYNADVPKRENLAETVQAIKRI
ncbi:putative tail lysin [Staphylococcus phage vB_SauH_DELF3]|nr:putative tail lysin [Staphylococcus phage vB_SauH_DELF3]